MPGEEFDPYLSDYGDFDYYGAPSYGGGQIEGSYGPGQGAYSIGDQTYDIYAPGQTDYAPTRYASAGDYDAMRGAPPSPRTSGYSMSGPTSSMDSTSSAWGYAPPSMPAPRPSGGGGGYTPQPMQRVALGSPERTLYDRYRDMLLNPEKVTQDPAYQFLFNQGKQALDRSLAAKRLTYSGKALNDTIAYGAGQAASGFKTLMPEYRAGAQEELRRFMGPAGLLPQYTSLNNQATQAEGSSRAAADMLPYYQRMLEMGGGGPDAGASRIGYGGVNSGYTQRLNPADFRAPVAQAPGGYDNFDLDEYGSGMLA